MHWLPIVAPAVTAFVGSGIATAAVTHWLTIKRAREELLRAKLEELFLEVSGYCTQGVQSRRPYLSAMEGKITYNKASEMFLKDIERFLRHNEYVQMLVNLYFPEHRERLAELVAALNTAQGILKAFEQNYSSEQASQEVAKRYSDALNRFVEIGRQLRAEISGASTKLLRPPSMLERLKRSFWTARK
jgi:uncharacterized protein YgbK (DUF1537 family)